MDPDPAKLRQKETEVAAQAQHQRTQPQNAQEFSSVEEMLRFDAAQTSVPESLPKRLDQSLAQEPKPHLPWWRRLFGRKPPP